MLDERVLVSRRQQRAQENQIGHARGDLVDGLPAGVHHDELCADTLGKYAAQDIGLHLVWLDDQNGAHINFEPST